MNIFLVAATRANPNANMLLEYLLQKLRILKSYLGDKFNDQAVQADFTLVYELLDETMDYGYPQNCSVDVLKLYINLGSTMATPAHGATGSQLTSQITGAVDWRREGLRYRNNEVYIDLHETVTLLLSQTGTVLRAETNGTVMMRTSLSGMPECKFALNDKLNMDRDSAKNAGAGGLKPKSDAVEIDDCSFHRCVRLSKYDTERTITFIPPDGEFKLMSYRVTTVNQPFTLRPTITEEGKTLLNVSLTVR